MLSVGCFLLLLLATAPAAPPSISFTVQPTEPDAAGSLVYARIGAPSGPPTVSGRLWFKVRVTNHSALIDYQITRVFSARGNYGKEGYVWTGGCLSGNGQ